MLYGVLMKKEYRDSGTEKVRLQGILGAENVYQIFVIGG